MTDAAFNIRPEQPTAHIKYSALSNLGYARMTKRVCPDDTDTIQKYAREALRNWRVALWHDRRNSNV